MGPPLFCFVITSIVSKLWPKYEAFGVHVEAYVDDFILHFKEITEEAMQVVSDLIDELRVAGIIVYRAKSSALAPPGHEMTPTERTSQRGRFADCRRRHHGGWDPDWNGRLRRGMRHEEDNRRGLSLIHI